MPSSVPMQKIEKSVANLLIYSINFAETGGKTGLALTKKEAHAKDPVPELIPFKATPVLHLISAVKNFVP